MDDLTRRQAIKAAATAGAVATGTVGLVTAQEQGKGQRKGEGQGGQVRLLTTIEIVCRNVFGSQACLNFIEEDGQFFFEVRYRNNAGRVRIADSEQDINIFGITFRIRISEVDIQGRNISARVRLQARGLGQVITIIDERVNINFIANAPVPVSNDPQPVITYGDPRAQGGGEEKKKDR
jgi:hypothetical protein